MPDAIRMQCEVKSPRQFADDGLWAELARKYYLRLPVRTLPADDEHMRKWLRKLRIREPEYLAMTGFKSLEDFRRLNPDWNLRAWVGLLLEYVVERDEAKGVLRAYDRD